MTKEKVIKVSLQTWRRLVMIRDRLSIEKGRNQTINDAIMYLLEKCEEI